MSKTLMAFCLGVVALAGIAAPSIAAASPVLTQTGTSLAVGTKITGTNVGNVKFESDPASGAGETFGECRTGTLTGTTVKNNGTVVLVTVTTATLSGTGAPITVGGMNSCTSTSGLVANFSPTTNGGGVDGENVTSGTPWCIRLSGVADEFTVRGGGCDEAERKMTMLLDLANPFSGFDECKYERESALIGTFTTEATGDAILKVAPGTTGTEKAKATFKSVTGNSFRCPSNFTVEMSYTLETDAEPAEALYLS